MGNLLCRGGADDSNKVVIPCRVTKCRFRFETAIPAKWRHKVDAHVWSECMLHIRDAIGTADCNSLRRKSKNAKRFAIVCGLVCCSCLTSAIITWLSAWMYHHQLYYSVAAILFAVSAIAAVLFVTFAYHKLKYDNLWRLKVYGAISERFNYLNQHMILKQSMTFKLTNAIASTHRISACDCFECFGCICMKMKINGHDSKYFARQSPSIEVQLKVPHVSLPHGTVYSNRVNVNQGRQLAQDTKTYRVIIDIQQDAKTPFLSDYTAEQQRLVAMPPPSAPTSSICASPPQQPHQKYAYNPELFGER